MIDKILQKIVKIDEDKTSLRLQGLKMLAEFKIPFITHIKIEADFKTKKREPKK